MRPNPWRPEKETKAVGTYHLGRLFPQALKEEHREMKKLVLDHERRQEEEEYKGEREGSLQQRRVPGCSPSFPSLFSFDVVSGFASGGKLHPLSLSLSLLPSPSPHLFPPFLHLSFLPSHHNPLLPLVFPPSQDVKRGEGRGGEGEGRERERREGERRKEWILDIHFPHLCHT